MTEYLLKTCYLKWGTFRLHILLNKLPLDLTKFLFNNSSQQIIRDNKTHTAILRFFCKGSIIPDLTLFLKEKISEFEGLKISEHVIYSEMLK